MCLYNQYLPHAQAVKQGLDTPNILTQSYTLSSSLQKMVEFNTRIWNWV